MQMMFLENLSVNKYFSINQQISKYIDQIQQYDQIICKIKIKILTFRQNINKGNYSMNISSTFSNNNNKNNQQLSENQLSPSLSPIKKNKSENIQPNILNYQRFTKNFTSQDKSTKNHIKFYQKTNKKIQNNIFKHKIDSIKPITCHQYQDNQFIIQSKGNTYQSRNNDQNRKFSQQEFPKFSTPCIGLINPMYINVKSNLKRLANSTQLMKDKRPETENAVKSLKKNKQMITAGFIPNEIPKKQKQTQTLYFRIVSEMNEYFNSMKLDSFKNNKTQLLSKRNVKIHSQKRQFNTQTQARSDSRKYSYKSYAQDQNLNIVGLKPLSSSDYKRMNRNYSSNSNNNKKQSIQTNKNDQSSMRFYESQQFKRYNQRMKDQSPDKDIKFQVTPNDISSMIISSEIYASPSRRIQEKSKNHNNNRPFTQQIRNRSPVKNKAQIYKGFCFGQIINSKNTTNQIHRLKILYYKDLLWKNSFNAQIKYLPPKNQNGEQLTLRYFVGKGNNSKLIKNIMAKRWWWTLDNKQENSQFLWTQLKIYSIYEKQNTYDHDQQISQKQISQKVNNSSNVKIQIKPELKNTTDNSSLILNIQKRQLWQQYIFNRDNCDRERKITEQNLTAIRKRLQKKAMNFTILDSPTKMTNHLQFSKAIGNKKALYKVMMTYFLKIKKYSEDEIYVPLTYHITAGLEDQQYLKFLSEYYRRNKNTNKTCWIVKPGELTNRGKGIQYCRDLNQIKPMLKKKQSHSNGSLKTFLIQQYLDRPLLYRGRKFDIRHYIMVSSTNGKIRGYFYQKGYIRTTSYKYKLDDNSPAIHLTNDAVQKYCKDYGKYQKGNKLSYEEFDAYLQENQPNQNPQKQKSFFNTIYPQIKKISTDVIHGAYYFIDPKRKINNFQIFGLDIMVDQNFKCYLIEANTNPCLQLSSPVLKNVIPEMLDNAFALTLDHCYPPPEKQVLHLYHKKFKYPISPQNKFQLVFDEYIDGKLINQAYKLSEIETNEMSGIGDDDENFESCQDDDQDC